MLQKTALDILKTGANVFLTGSAGAGKTYTLLQYLEWLKEQNVKGSKIAVTASTGIAATHLDGSTIHSWSGIGIKEEMTDDDIINMMTRNKGSVDRIRKTQVLIIDEISMLHRKQLDLIDRVVGILRGDTRPFGGMQVILVGDFFQLPPVAKREANEGNTERFCFMSQAWVDSKFTVCYLTEQHRNGDDALNDVLNAVRDCNVEQQHLDTLNQRRILPESPDEIMHLYTHNANVDVINMSRLKKLTTESKRFQSTSLGNEKKVEMLRKSVLAPEVLELKIGAKVMFVKNNPEDGFANGTQGEVVAFVKDEEFDPPILPVILTKRGNRIVAKPMKWELTDGIKTVAEITQIPLRLAWAITIHKSQGMTLDEAKINLGRCFEAGQGYVAISRLRSIEGLYLEELGINALHLNPLAIRANGRFLELSKESEDNFMNIKEEALKKSQGAFLKVLKRL